MAHDPALDQELFASTQRLHAISRRALADADVVGKPVDEARERVEAAGLTVRPVQAGGVQTADWSATQVTATVAGGVVQHAEVR